MREILCITHKYPPTVGGMEKQSFELILGLEQYFTVHKIVYVENQGSKLRWFATLKKRIKKVLSDNPSIELIHVNDGLMSVACLWLLKYTSVPVVATIHGLDITFPMKLFQNRIVPKMRGLAATISVSQATREQCLKRGFTNANSYVVANGVDHDLERMPQDTGVLTNLLKTKGIDASKKRIVVTMGRAVKRKGFSWFVKEVLPGLDDDILFVLIGPMKMKSGIGEHVFKFLPKKMQESLELMLGLPSDQKDLKSALASKEVAGKAVHLGKLPFGQLMAVVGSASLFVMPNISVAGDAEGFGLVALEASLRGTPVVASGIEGITQAVKHDGNGLLLESRNAQQWVTTINELLDDSARLESLAEKTVNYTKDNFSWTKMADEYAQIFESILKN